MFKKFKTELYTYYKMSILAFLSIAGIILMGQNQVAQNVLSGLAIFLLGMLFLEDGFRGFSGGFLERVLKKLSNTRVKSIFFGLITTAIMQSSSLVTILTLSFLSASLVSLGQALGIVFGANIGSTTSGWIIAGIGVKINVSALGLPLITLGVLLLFAKNKNLKSLGYILAGIGFFFLGISYIKTGFEGYSNAFSLNAIGFNKAITFAIFFFTGILITSIVQSSFATLTIIILALNAQSISYNDALALVIGTNVGGVVTALIASISSSVDGKRLAVGNTIFNFIIAVVCIIFLPVFKEIVELLASLFGFAEDDYAIKIALFHTSYNIIAVLLISPFIPVFEKFLNSFITSSQNDSDKPQYLDLNLIPYQNTAKEALQEELTHLFDNTILILSTIIGCDKKQILDSTLTKEQLSKNQVSISDEDLEELYTKKIKNIFNAIIDFSTHLRASYDDVIFGEEIGELQKASRDLAEATKNLKIIKSNLINNTHSNNPFLKEQCLNIKFLLAHTISQLNAMRNLPADEFQHEIKKLKKSLKTKDKHSIDDVQELLKECKITPAEATSILNDIAFSIKSLKEIASAALSISKSHTIESKTKSTESKAQPQAQSMQSSMDSTQIDSANPANLAQNQANHDSKQDDRHDDKHDNTHNTESTIESTTKPTQKPNPKES